MSDNFLKGRLSRMDRRLFLDWDANAYSEADDGVKVSTEVAKLHPNQSYHEDFGDEMVKRWNGYAELERWLSNLTQDQCENALVPTSLLDACRQALHELKPDHPILQNQPPSFGVWESQRKTIEDLKSNLRIVKMAAAIDAETVRNLQERVTELEGIVESQLCQGCDHNTRKEIEQLRVQLAGCSVAALGLGDPIEKDAYGWSQSYQDVLDLRKKLLEKNAAATAEIERLKKDRPRTGWSK